MSRRHFLLTAGYGAVGFSSAKLLGQTGQTTATPAGETKPMATATGLRIRKNIASLNEQSSEIVSFKNAVTRMRALPANDKRTWRNQAEIHGAILGGFGSCRHSSWYFFPWHRAYLHCFEEIVRELSGDDRFALPYWDWSTEFTLPGLFWGDNNPLANPARPGEPGSGRRSGLSPSTGISQGDIDRFVSRGVIAQILGIPDFETFAGGAASNLDDASAQGRLENGPHNFIHRWVGGDMVTGGSPYDPIFWLHHCNIDRLWTEWVRKHPNGTPNDNTWLNATFRGDYKFYDRKGQPLETLTVRQLLNPAKLGYRYDEREKTALPQLTAAFVRPRLVAGPSVGTFRVEDGISESLVTPSKRQAERLRNLIEAEPKEAGRETARMRLLDVNVPKEGDVLLQVHVNCEKVSPDLPVTDPSYVGSCTFFSHTGHVKHDSENQSTSFMFSLNQTFARLYADRPLSESEPLKVVVITKPLFTEEKRLTPAQIQELSPKQVSFEIVSSAASA